MSILNVNRVVAGSGNPTLRPIRGFRPSNPDHEVIKWNKSAGCGNFDIILAHFSRSAVLYTTSHAPRAVGELLHADRVLVGACNPML